jgi:hypothetical protein
MKDLLSKLIVFVAKAFIKNREIVKLTRFFDWSQTALDTYSNWSQSLRIVDQTKISD